MTLRSANAAEDFRKYVSKVCRAETGEVECLIRTRCCIGDLLRVVPVAVVYLALLRVGENIESLGDLFEALLRLPVARVDIRVVTASKPAICLLYVFRPRVSRNPEQFVVVFAG